MTVAELQARRERMGFPSAAELARAIGVSPQSIANYESGRRPVPDWLDVALDGLAFRESPQARYWHSRWVQAGGVIAQADIVDEVGGLDDELTIEAGFVTGYERPQHGGGSGFRASSDDEGPIIVSGEPLGTFFPSCDCESPAGGFAQVRSTAEGAAEIRVVCSCGAPFVRREAGEAAVSDARSSEQVSSGTEEAEEAESGSQGLRDLLDELVRAGLVPASAVLRGSPRGALATALRIILAREVSARFAENLVDRLCGGES